MGRTSMSNREEKVAGRMLDEAYAMALRADVVQRGRTGGGER